MDLARATETDFHGWLGAGDLRRAGEWLVLRYADEVIALCGAMVRDRQAAEDLTQDVFQRAFSALAAFRGEASTRTWLLQIARNRCIDHLRARNRTLWSDGDEASEPDAHPDDAPLPPDLILRRADVEAALSQLAEGERALVVLRFKNGLEHAELAEAFGLREGTVRMRLSRALAKMRDLLDRRNAAGPMLDAATPPRAPARAPAPAPRSAPAPAAAAPPPELLDERSRTAVTRAGTVKPGFIQRLLHALSGGSTRSPRRMPPDHPLSHYFMATLDARDDRMVARLVDDARELTEPGT